MIVRQPIDPRQVARAGRPIGPGNPARLPDALLRWWRTMSQGIRHLAAGLPARWLMTIRTMPYQAAQSLDHCARAGRLRPRAVRIVRSKGLGDPGFHRQPLLPPASAKPYRPGQDEPLLGGAKVLTSLLFVSPCTADSAWVGELPSLTEPISERPYSAEVTGALLFTEHHFAGLFEGHTERIAVLAEIIAAFPGHEQLRMVQVKQIATRRFPALSVGYAGTSSFVDRYLATVFEADSVALTELAADLVQLMFAFVRDCSSKGDRRHGDPC